MFTAETRRDAEDSQRTEYLCATSAFLRASAVSRRFHHSQFLTAPIVVERVCLTSCVGIA
jgi:hypothetical protein